MSRAERWAIFRLPTGAYTVALDDDRRALQWERIHGVATVNGGRSICEAWNADRAQAADIRRAAEGYGPLARRER